MFSKAAAWLARCLIVAFGLALVIGCQSDSLSDRGSEELAAHIEKLAGTAVLYEILSVEEAPGYSDAELDLNVNYTGSNEVSGCPDINGGRALWCVVLDREISGTTGNSYSRFLVQQLSGIWYVEELSATESAEFYEIGCKNWDAAITSQE